MKFDVTLASFLLALALALLGWIRWWLDKQKFEKHQAALDRQQAIQQANAAAVKMANEERDFNHLRSNQLQISQGIATGFDAVEEKIDNLRELMLKIEAYLIRNQDTNHHE